MIPWDITILYLKGSTELIITGNIAVTLPYGSKPNIELYIAGTVRVISSVSEVHTIVDVLKELVRDKLKRSKSTQIDELKKMLADVKKENKQLRENMEELKLALTFHPNGVEANLLKKDFENLSIEQKRCM
jgi:trans-2-enoyl-CoA reductase